MGGVTVWACAACGSAHIRLKPSKAMQFFMSFSL
jgi:hypothetical protein